MRAVMATVRSRVEPPAPYVTDTNVGLERLEPADRLPQLAVSWSVRRREELEGERLLAAREQLADGRGAAVHRGRESERHGSQGYERSDAVRRSPESRLDRVNQRTA
jgi:hypothetical protein